MPRTRIAPEKRFWLKVDVGLCWEWTASLNACGYGQFNPNGVPVLAHRFAWELLVGPIPPGLQLDHLCRNRRCVNPDHLEPVTNRENARRGAAGAHHKVKTRCPRGHQYDYRNSSGGRECRECRNDHERRRYHARRSSHA